MFVHQPFPAMNTPQANTATSAPPVARQQSAPSTSNVVATDLDFPNTEGEAYLINKNGTML